jgi:ribonucleotide reductase beta subunit family protein with ferritin-like domain
VHTKSYRIIDRKLLKKEKKKNDHINRCKEYRKPIMEKNKYIKRNSRIGKESNKRFCAKKINQYKNVKRHIFKRKR